MIGSHRIKLTDDKCRNKKELCTKGYSGKSQIEIFGAYLRKWLKVSKHNFFYFYMGFLSRTFTIHRTAGDGGEYLFNSSTPFPPASQTFRQ